MVGLTTPPDAITGDQLKPATPSGVPRPDLIGARSRFKTELSDPRIRRGLLSLTHAEVGGQGAAAHQAFMESVFNRASARNKSLADTVFDRGYFPGITFQRMRSGVPGNLDGHYGSILDSVINGSNISNFATGNASGTVGFAGGPQTYAVNGERFGVEGPDRKWVTQVNVATPSSSNHQPGTYPMPSPMALGMTQPPGGVPPSKEQVDLYRQRGMALMPNWSQPVRHWTQALGNVVQQISGSMWLDKAEKAMGDRRNAENASWGGIASAMVPGLSRPPVASGATSAAASGFGPQGMTSPPQIDNAALAPQKPRIAAEAQPAVAGGQVPQPATASPAPVATPTLPNGAGAGVLSGIAESADPVAQRSPLTPVSTQPQSAPVDTRVNEIDQQIDAINGQVRALAPYLQNEATRSQAWQALQQLEQRRMHYEDMRINRSDPSEVMKRRLLELNIRSQERALEEPPWDLVDIGKDKYGNPIKGWANKRTQVVRPINPGSQQTALDPNLHGEEFLKTLDPQMAATVKAIAEGRQPYPGAFALKQPYWQKVTEYLSQYEPNTDANLYRTRYATQKDFATGKMGQNIASFNTALGHMHDLYKQIDGLNNLDTMPILNGPINAVAGAVSGDSQARINTFNATAGKVIAETEKAFKGMGATVDDMRHARAELNAAQSPSALKATVRKYLDLMKSRIAALGDQYNRGMAVAQPRAALSLLSPHSQKIVRELEGDGHGDHADNYMVGSPQPAPAPSSAPVEGAKQAPDGHWYLPDPQRPGKYLMVQ